jgi:hypothetical protein
MWITSTVVGSTFSALIIAAGVFLWGEATMACGFVRTVGQLFAARMAVEVGEGALSPRPGIVPCE